MFEVLVHDLQAMRRMAKKKKAKPITAIIDSRTLRSTSERSSRAGYEGAKRNKRSKLHIVVDTLEHLLVVHVSRQTGITGQKPTLWLKPFSRLFRRTLSWRGTDQSYISSKAAKAGGELNIILEIISFLQKKHIFVLLH
ncbi:hypothetical protein [Acetobacter oeni]|uniref:Transposase IS4-like domain-containing protein n=1 Tax=Acetobacter oeni TaxID=304077 RepID=A0A511XJR5_9PROT|nr:hypothetical protein [Acetobacter oeni]MBB3883412.1 hypothetical protein [Acetobacter oeni]NHO19385.1 hypothetical protein [Acetobacter oeni]GEN63193.1 hypothetical protein AOE01nite_14170 [Acetobacter oeni]